MLVLTTSLRMDLVIDSTPGYLDRSNATERFLYQDAENADIMRDIEKSFQNILGKYTLLFTEKYTDDTLLQFMMWRLLCLPLTFHPVSLSIFHLSLFLHVRLLTRLRCVVYFHFSITAARCPSNIWCIEDVDIFKYC